MDKDDVGLDEIRVKPRAEVVGHHEAGQLVDAEVLVGKKRRVDLVPTEEQASVDVGGNHDGDVAEMVCAERNAEEHHEVVNEEGVGPGKPTIKVALSVVL